MTAKKGSAPGTPLRGSIRVADPGTFPLHRVLREDGTGLVEGEHGPLPEPAQLRAIHRAMLTTRLLDDRLLKLQRQGKVSFVGTATGLEAAIHGAAAAFAPEDWIFSGLRESAVALQRGMALDEFLAQMFGNAADPAKGRQMANHVMCRAANFPSWSSVVGTQLAHAVGVALAFQQRREPQVVGAFCGDGATSSNGFHSGLNFAGVFKAPVVFIVVDNGWAISVPSARQTAARSYGAKGRAYGIPGVDVDGNDVLAVYVEVCKAVGRARSGGGPSLICLRTYRLGGHSSSDDPGRYRDPGEYEYWSQRDPLRRFERWLEAEGLLVAAQREELVQQIQAEIAAAVARQEAVGPPPLQTLVEDVYDLPPPALRRQVVEALRVVAEKGEAEQVAGKFPL